MPRIPWFEMSRQALGTTQEGLGRMLGVSRRTAQRWSGSGIPSAWLVDLARVVHPRSPDLAGDIVAAAGKTLESAGIVAPAPPAPTRPPLPEPEFMVDAVVCAAAEAMDQKPTDVRPGLLAAFARTKAIGLTLDDVERVLRARLAPKPAKKAARGRR